MNNGEERNPFFEILATVIITGALVKNVYTKGVEWCRAVQDFFCAIWPTVCTIFVSLAVGYFLLRLGKFGLEKLREHKKYIAGLLKKIEDSEKSSRAKDVTNDRLQQALLNQKAYSARLKRGLTRYHRILTRKYSVGEQNPKQTQRKIQKALDSVLQDFGGTGTSQRNERP